MNSLTLRYLVGKLNVVVDSYLYLKNLRLIQTNNDLLEKDGGAKNCIYKD